MIKIYKKQISQNIKFFRQKKNLTQADLADNLKVSRSVVTKWENNLVTPDITSIIKLSILFNVSLDDIIGNYSFQEDVLKEYKNNKQIDSNDFDQEILEAVEYLMFNPKFQKDVSRLNELSGKKQISIQKLVSILIDQYEKL